MNNNVEKASKDKICLGFQHSQPKVEIILASRKAMEIIWEDLFQVNDTNFLYIVDYFSKFLIIKWAGQVSDLSLIACCKSAFPEYGLPKKILSDLGPNFISERFMNFCKSLNIKQALSSSFHRQRNGQAVMHQFVKCTMKKCIEANNDINIVLLHIISTSVDWNCQGLLDCWTIHP